MAAKKQASPEVLGAIDPSKVYRVTLARAVKHGPTWLRPGARVRLSGAALAELQDAVASFEERA